MEKFKKSKKSICLECSNIENTCASLGGKICDTDNEIGLAYVKKCAWINKEMVHTKQTKHTVSVDHKPESRIDMMGGGHNLGM